MRIFLGCLGILAGLALAGCGSVAPDFPGAKTTRVAKPERVAVRRAPIVATRRPADVTGSTPRPAEDRLQPIANVPSKPPAPAVAEIRPFSPEWYARENEEQERLRRSMRICRGC